MRLLSRRMAVPLFVSNLITAVVTGGTLGLQNAPVLAAANDNHKTAANDNIKPKAPNNDHATAKPADADGQAAPAVNIDDKVLLDHIAQCEGTATQAGDGYSTSLDYGRWLPGGQEQDLTVLSLDQIDALQTEMLSHPENAARYAGGGSSAIGRYQLVRRTLRSLRTQLKLRGDQLFDAALQDRLGLYLARQRGATRGLGSEWASLTGKKLDKAIELARKALAPRK